MCECAGSQSYGLCNVVGRAGGQLLQLLLVWFRQTSLRLDILPTAGEVMHCLLLPWGWFVAMFSRMLTCEGHTKSFRPQCIRV